MFNLFIFHKLNKITTQFVKRHNFKIVSAIFGTFVDITKNFNSSSVSQMQFQKLFFSICNFPRNFLNKANAR